MKIIFMAIGYPSPLDQRELEIPEGTSLDVLFKRISGDYGLAGLAGVLALNERVVEQPEAEGIILKDGDRLILAPPLSGG